MSIGRRILLLIFIPCFVLVGFAGWIIWQRLAAVRESAALVAGEHALVALDDLVGALQRERGRSATPWL
ncbi:MAG TPA: hypothetical protein VL048_16705 [Xanthobacteraceae bacterium]|nr:hypothetical protein [Xanthobacteraceae bacterium]